MAKYKINGSEFNVDDAQQGEELQGTLQQLADMTASQNRTKFLNFIGAAEGASYDTIVGGKQKVTDFSQHPNIVGLQTANGSSTAAGKYQITNTTWNEMAPKLGVTDFSPASQDKVALALLARRGALEDVEAGNFDAAIGKIGKEWASMPSSTYGQSKRSLEWAHAQLGQTPPAQPGQVPIAADPVASVQAASAPAAATDGKIAATAAQEPYVPYAKVRENVDPATLNKDKDWLSATRHLYLLRTSKEFTGSDDELAEWGKDFMGYFNSSLLQMGRYAHDVNTNGTEQDKKAFLYMMDTYDNTQWSWEGAGRAAKGLAADPTTWVGAALGLVTAGGATAAEIGAAQAAKVGIRNLLLGAVGRSMGVAAVEGGLYGGVTDAAKQSVEVSAGREKSTDLGRLAVSTGAGAVGGVVLGTAADLAVTGISKVLQRVLPKGAEKGAAKEAEKAVAGEASRTPQEAPKETPATTPSTEPGSAAVGDPSASVPASAEAHVPEPEVKPGEVPHDLAERTILTEKEIFEATKRQQEGRLPEDDLPPVTPANPEAAAKIEVPDRNTGLRGTPRSMAELTADGEKIADQLRGLDDKTLHGVLESFRTGALPLEESQVIARGVQIHADELRIEQADIIKRLGLSKDPEESTKLATRLNEIEQRLPVLSQADDAFGSIAGSMLRQRQEGLPGMQGVSVESLMASKGLSREDAETEFVKLIEGAKNSADGQKIAADWDAKIQKALDQGDIKQVGILTAMKHRELDGLVQQEMPAAASFTQKATEFIISNLFSVPTLVVNALASGAKTLIVPALKLIVTNPLSQVARVEMVANYSAMRATFGGAVRASVAAFRYEQSLLTRGTGRIMEGEMAMKGRIAGAWRLFPRLLNATDEFLSQLNYASFVSGRAAAEAVVEGTGKGLKGQALDEYIRLSSEIAMKKAYTQPTGEALVQPLVNKGVNLGLTGDALHEFVLREIARDPEALRHGSDQEALDLTRDVLYKRNFSEKGAMSKMAGWYQQGMNKVPILRLISGQYFFRTPVRVFEEGIRLTPGLQFVAPGFISDLAGKNGMNRQVRAKGEALMSLGILGAITTMYASGRVTGDGAYSNWKQGRTREDGPQQPPYTIKMSDGSTWSYRNLDPIATPIKIIINGLERLDQIAIRSAQGEFNDDPNKTAFQNESKKAMAYLAVGFSAIGSAITDANLVQGAKQTGTLITDIFDPESKEDALLKFMGQKLAELVPNTLHKIAKMNDPTIKDPATFWQMVEAKLHYQFQDDIKTGLSYDVLGNVRQIADTGAIHNIFSTATPEERARGMSKDAQYVMTELDRLQKETSQVFSAPSPKNPEQTGQLDLRTVMTSDGKETLYDRWQRNFKELHPETALAPILAAPMPDGTQKYKGIRVESVNKILQMYQKAAFAQLMANEQKVIDQRIRTDLAKANAKAGLLDYSNRNR